MIPEYIVGLALDIAKEYVGEKLDERKLRSALSEYIERNREYQEKALPTEEFDFQGLVEYICSDLLNLAKNRVFASSRKKRGEARQQIIDMACAHASAETKEARSAVSRLVSACIDMIHDFYASQCDVKDYVIGESIVDAVAEESEANTRRILDKIDDSTRAILDTRPDGSLFSVDKALDLARNGELGRISEGIQGIMSHVSIEHPLYPTYGFEYSHGEIRSVPLDKDARERYPVRYVFTGAVKVGGKYMNDPGVNPLDYAYRHQLPLTMEVSKATRYLGDVPDPAQGSMGKMSELYARPSEFPPAIACAIKVGGQTYFEYVLLRMHEILDDGTAVISNEEQESHIRFTFFLNPGAPKKIDVKFSARGGSNAELLKLDRFAMALRGGKDIHVYALEEGKDYISGSFSDSFEGGFGDLEEEIGLLERLCAIEEYFNVNLKPGETISKGEYEVILKVSNLISKPEVTEKWETATLTGTVDQRFRETVLSMRDGRLALSFVGVYRVDLFGAEFELRFMRTYKDAHIEDFEKLQEKVKALDDGDSIKVTVRPGDDNTCVDTIHVPEAMDGCQANN